MLLQMCVWTRDYYYTRVQWVETNLSDQKNGTSAENGGTCAPYPIICEPELRLPYDWNHGWFRYFWRTYVSIDSINGVLHIIIVTVSNVFRRNFRSCHQKKMPSSRHFNCWGKLKKKSNFNFIFGQMIEDQVLFHLPKFGKNIFSLRGFPHPLKGHEKTVREGPRFGTLKYVSTLNINI